ncbi:MAG: hypothetical protein RH860_06060 [Cytophagales bacterium]
MKKLLNIFWAFAIILAGTISTQAQYAPGESLTPLPFYKGDDKGYAILKDGTKIEGDINFNKREMKIKNNSGKTYKLEDYSLKEYGLNSKSSMNYSPVQAYEWKDKKVKEYLYFGSNDDFSSNVKTKAQRGFVVLNDGTVRNGLIELKGKVKIIGGFHSENIFALDELVFTDDKENETKYGDKDLKGYGRTLPWNLSPSWMYKMVPDMMGMSTKKQEGFVLLHDGRKFEGEMSLFKKFIQNPDASAGGMDNMGSSDPSQKGTALAEFYTKATVKTADGKEKFDIDEVAAYGYNNMTINSITKNGTQTYPLDKMNFHRGSVELKDGTKKEGLLAYFPGPVNFYGVYFATSPDEALSIYSFDEMKNVDQEINKIQEFVGFGNLDVQLSPNNDINGYIMNKKGEKVEGTIKMIEANDWWCRSIEFTNKDNLTTSYGGEGKRIRYFVKDGNVWIQDRSVFVKGELPIPQEIFTYYMNPFPNTSSFIGSFVANALQNAVQNEVSHAMGNIESSAASSGWETQNTGTNDLVFASYGDFINYEDLPEGLAKAAFKDELVVYNHKSNEKMVLPKRGALRGKTEMEILLEGCIEFHDLEKDQQKSLAQYENSVEAITFLNKCYK